MKKRWFDDWKITRNLDGLGEIKIYLPNSEAGDKTRAGGSQRRGRQKD